MMSTFGSRNPRAIPGSAGRPLVAPDRRRGQRRPEPDVIPEPGPERAQVPAHARAQEEREEHHVRQPEPGCAPPGHDERDRQLAERGRMVLGDRLRRAPPDRVGVDERDDHARRAPPTTGPRTPTGTARPSARDRCELGEVRQHRCVEHRQEQRCDRQQGDADRQLARMPPDRQREPGQAEHRRHQEQRRRSPTLDQVESDDRCGATSNHASERDARRSVRRQRGPPGADGLEGVPKACFRRLVVE